MKKLCADCPDLVALMLSPVLTDPVLAAAAAVVPAAAVLAAAAGGGAVAWRPAGFP